MARRQVWQKDLEPYVRRPCPTLKPLFSSTALGR